MTATTLWVAVVAAGLGCYLLKLAGLSVPTAWLARPRVARTAELLPVALLAALVAVQVVAGTAADGDPAYVADARLPALGVAALLLWRRAPFLVVVVAGAATAAALRLLGLSA